MPPRPYTAADILMIRRMRKEGCSWRQIDEAQQRSRGACADKIRRIKLQQQSRSSGGNIGYVSGSPPSPEALREAAARALLQPASLTAAILGDPLPGRSALDQRAAQSTAKLLIEPEHDHGPRQEHA